MVNHEGWCLYILRCSNGSLYTGITNDLPSRVKKHKQGNGAKYTRSFPPKALEYIEEAEDRSEASKLEYKIKSFPKSKKENLVKTQETINL